MSPPQMYWTEHIHCRLVFSPLPMKTEDNGFCFKGISQRGKEMGIYSNIKILKTDNMEKAADLKRANPKLVAGKGENQSNLYHEAP